MKFFIKCSLILLLILNVSCKNKYTNKLIIAEEELDIQLINAYKEGLELLNKGDGLGASKKFSDAELLYPQ